MVNNFLQKNFEDPNAEDINNSVDSFNGIVLNVASKSLRFKKPVKTNRKVRKHKKWFDEDLQQKRKLTIEKGELLSQFPHDPIVKGDYYKCYKEYNRLRKLRKRQFKQNVLDQLDEMRDNDPKKYWNLIRSLQNEEDLNHNSIPEDKWHSYFKQLNAIPDNFKEQIDNINQKLNALEENSASFSELDFRISEKEISEAIDKLKKNKAAGLDGIPNEIFKGGKAKFLPILHKLFNLVLNTGMYPKQ